MRRFLLLLLFSILFAVIATAIFYYDNKPESHSLVLYGNVDVRQVDLGFRVGGRIEKLHFQEGDIVEEGALMATLEQQPYLDQLKEAEAEKSSIQYSLLNAESIFKRRKELVKGGGISEEDLSNAATSRDVYTASLRKAKAAIGVALKNLDDTHLKSPSKGTILTRIREPGAVVRDADPVYTLSLLSPVWIRAYIAEPDLGKIYPGMEADISTDTEGMPTYKGRIGFISPVAEFTPKTVETTQLRTDLVYRIRVYADNPDHLLKQGMPATVTLNTAPQVAKQSAQ